MLVIIFSYVTVKCDRPVPGSVGPPPQRGSIAVLTLESPSGSRMWAAKRVPRTKAKEVVEETPAWAESPRLPWLAFWLGLEEIPFTS